MLKDRKIKSALISVFSKNGLDDLVFKLNEKDVKIYSTGGTQSYIEGLGIKVVPVEELTDYPSILGGRVKTLHPKVFGGILSRREDEGDIAQLQDYNIPEIDLVIVDLYPFEDTVKSGAEHQDIIEKIDIGGISLIRAAAKNYKDVLVVSSKDQYASVVDSINDNGATTSLDQRKEYALQAFSLTSHYDSAIHDYFNNDTKNSNLHELRYGENPHQKGWFSGKLQDVFNQLHGKAISYNNLLDIDAAIMLMEDFKDQPPTFAILKHNNACGFATRPSVREAYSAALACDPVSAFGGILIANEEIDLSTANLINSLFCEVVIAPSFNEQALDLLKSKKNRIILKQHTLSFAGKTVRSCLNGQLIQERDTSNEEISSFEVKTKKSPSKSQMQDLFFC